MPKHDFSDLLDKYPKVIAEMDKFTSHKFILTLAQKYQMDVSGRVVRTQKPLRGAGP